MCEDTTFQELLRQVRAGDDWAAAELLHRYEPAIRRAVRVRLVDQRLERLFDSMDICQSVMGSFFVRAALGQYDLEEPDDLLKLLVRMARNKLADAAKKQRASPRDYRRQTTDGLQAAESLAAGATPSQEVAARELLQKFRERLAPEERDLAEQRALGRAWADIAAERGGRPEALRKQLARAIGRVASQLGLAELIDP